MSRHPAEPTPSLYCEHGHLKDECTLLHLPKPQIDHAFVDKALRDIGVTRPIDKLGVDSRALIEALKVCEQSDKGNRRLWPRWPPGFNKM